MNKKIRKIMFFALLLFIYSCDYKIPAFVGSYCWSENYIVNNTSDSTINFIENFKEKNSKYKVIKTDEQGHFYQLDQYENRLSPSLEMIFDTTIHVWNGDTSYVTTSRYPTSSFTLTKTDSSIWYHFYFYFSDIKATISCVINVHGTNSPTIIRLTNVIFETSDLYDIKTINKRSDIARKENRMIKKKFEMEILDQLGVKWRHERWWD